MFLWNISHGDDVWLTQLTYPGSQNRLQERVGGAGRRDHAAFLSSLWIPFHRTYVSRAWWVGIVSLWTLAVYITKDHQKLQCCIVFHYYGSRLRVLIQCCLLNSIFPWWLALLGMIKRSPGGTPARIHPPEPHRKSCCDIAIGYVLSNAPRASPVQVNTAADLRISYMHQNLSCVSARILSSPGSTGKCSRLSIYVLRFHLLSYKVVKVCLFLEDKR